MPLQIVKLGNKYTQPKKRDRNKAPIEKAKKQLPCKDHIPSKTKFI